MVFFLLSGGGSALVEQPLFADVSLEDMQALHRGLVTCGAPIDEMNAVRKHFSAVKGGRLEWKFNDPGDIRTFTVPLPLIASKVSGTILPAGQGWFTMAKSGGGIA